MTILLTTVVIFHFHSAFTYPMARHNWAQADWYSISLGFIDNGFNFFKPQTYQLNLQFPADESIVNTQGITPADFPVIPYFAAIIMKITGIEHPAVFRILSLILAIFSIILLYKAILLHTRNFNRAILISGFIAFSPFLVYYRDGFLPSFNAFYLAILSAYPLAIYAKRQKTKYFGLVILLLTLSALVRFPNIKILLALALTMTYNTLFISRIKKRELFMVFTAILIVFGYFMYNRHLALKYGSLFLSSPMPPTSLPDFLNTTKHILPHFWNWLTLPGFIIVIWLGMKTLKSKLKFDYEQKKITVFLIILTTGDLLYSILMLRQFPVHDYYMADVFLIPMLTLIYVWSESLCMDNKSVCRKWIYISLFVMFIQSGYLQYKNYFSQRPKKNGELIDYSFKGSDEFLLQQGYGRNSVVLILDGPGSNMSLNRLRRKGYKVWTKKFYSYKSLMNMKYDVIITPDTLFHEIVLQDYPDWKKHHKVIAENGKITLWLPIKDFSEPGQ